LTTITGRPFRCSKLALVKVFEKVLNDIEALMTTWK
jgi:hypothetical protein